jgi:hypothetical protein
MSKTDFNRTSEQVERDTLSLIDRVERSLETSTSESERKGQLIFGAILSVIVFFSILAFEHFVGSKQNHSQPDAANPQEKISVREIELIQLRMQRIERELHSLESTVERFAPSAPTDSNIQNIRDSIEDIQSLLQSRPKQPTPEKTEQSSNPKPTP